MLNNPLTLSDPTGFDDDDDNEVKRQEGTADASPNGSAGGTPAHASDATVKVVGNVTIIEFSTGSTVEGRVPQGPSNSVPAAPPPTVHSEAPPPPPPPPPNDDGRGGAALLGPPPNAGIAAGDRSPATLPQREPSQTGASPGQGPTAPDHLFWSGDQNKWSAFIQSRRRGWTTLEMTNQGLLGTVFNLVFSKESNPVLTAYWYHATIEFAATSKGTAHAFVDASGAIPPSLLGWVGSFWLRIELPILLNNPDVKAIQFYMATGYPLGRLVRTENGWRQDGPLSSWELLADKARDIWDRLLK